MILRFAGLALAAGCGAGLVASVLHLWFVQPVLLHAELFENGRIVHYGPDGPAPWSFDTAGFDPARDGLTIFFTLAIYTGWAFMLCALMDLAGRRGARISGHTGMVWGVAGFVATLLAPAFSAPPELPGVAGIDIQIRQYWWFATVIATGTGLWLIAFSRHWALLGVAVALLLAPHSIGLPSPDVFFGPAPPELGALMSARAIGVGLAAWVTLGALAGHLMASLTRSGSGHTG